MAKEIRADPGALSDLADASLTAAGHVGDHFRAGYGDLSVPAAAFGNLGGAAALHGTCTTVLRDAQSVVTELAAVLEGDAERLWRTAFAYHEADRLADQRMGGARGASA